MLCTSGTVTSAELAEQRLPPGVIHQFVPLDAPRFVTRFLDHWRPDLALFVESDLWPNLIMASAERGIPLILVNGRLSERSFRPLAARPRAPSARCCAASISASRNRPRMPSAIAISARRASPPPATSSSTCRRRRPIPSSLAALQAAIGERTGHRRGLDPCRRGDHADRGAPAAARARSRGCSRSSRRAIPSAGPASSRSRRPPGSTAALRSRGELPEPDTDIYVADTMGELGLIYRLAPIVFIGGSLASHGGQNPIEPIKLGAAILHGPHVWNFAEIYAALDKSHGAEQVTDVGKLAVRVGAWLKDADARAHGGRGRARRRSTRSAARSSARSPRSNPI